MVNRANNSGDERERTSPGKTRLPRTPFVFGGGAWRKVAQSKKLQDVPVDNDGSESDKADAKAGEGDAIIGGQSRSAGMIETVKTLIETAREQGHLTYDDINEVV